VRLLVGQQLVDPEEREALPAGRLVLQFAERLDQGGAKRRGRPVQLADTDDRANQWSGGLERLQPRSNLRVQFLHQLEPEIVHETGVALAEEHRQHRGGGLAYLLDGPEETLVGIRPLAPAAGSAARCTQG